MQKCLSLLHGHFCTVHTGGTGASGVDQVPSGALGSASSVRGEKDPARKLRSAAMPIIAALSPQARMGGTVTRTPRFSSAAL